MLAEGMVLSEEIFFFLSGMGYHSGFATDELPNVMSFLKPYISRLFTLPRIYSTSIPNLSI